MMDDDVAQQLKEFAKLKLEHAALKEFAKMNNDAAEILTDLVKKGDVNYNPDGTVSVPSAS